MRCDDDTMELDNCEICLGSRGGVPGNENIVDGKTMCDYCSVDYYDKQGPIIKMRERVNEAGYFLSTPFLPSHDFKFLVTDSEKFQTVFDSLDAVGVWLEGAKAKTMTDLRPSGCPEFITCMCPICGIMVGGRQRHPDAQGAGVGKAFERIRGEDKNKEVPECST